MFKSSTSLKRLKAQVVKVAILVAGHSVYYCTVGCPRLWQFRSVMQPRGPLSHASSNASPIHESSPSYLSTSSSTTQYYQAVDIYVLMYVCTTYIGSIFWKPKTLQPAADTSHWMSSSGRFFFLSYSVWYFLVPIVLPEKENTFILLYKFSNSKILSFPNRSSYKINFT